MGGCCPLCRFMARFLRSLEIRGVRFDFFADLLGSGYYFCMYKGCDVNM